MILHANRKPQGALGLAETIGVTANHPFWSADRQAGDLHPHETLRNRQVTFVIKVFPRD